MEKTIIIPDDVMEEILLRLPVKDLLAWKCVSKHWYYLISDDEFVKKHYRLQYAMHLAAQGDVPLLLRSEESDPITKFYLLTKQSAWDVVVDFTPNFDRDVVPPTFSGDPLPHQRLMQCIGVVNGIVGLVWGGSRMALWNPATRDFMEVSRWPIIPGDKILETYGGNVRGLGFDLLSNDFKIFGLLCHELSRSRTDPGFIYEYHLYSLKADSWKKIKDTPRTYPVLDYPYTDAYFNNGVHYGISYSWDYSRVGIVAFNFSSEIFKEIELPGVQESWDNCHLEIGKYKEGLAVFADRTLESKETCIEIWAAIRFRDDDDYEVPLSWEIVVKTSPILYAEAYGIWIGAILDTEDILVTVYHVDNEELDEELRYDSRFADRRGAYVYHPSTCAVKYLGIRISSRYRYVESLFPLSRRLNYISSDRQ